jgi:two-component system OmpR family sensor kinase
MPEEDAARAFDRFYRGPERASRQDDERDQGTSSGLGLSIVQAIAAAHGGQAVLESQPGSGTRVRIWLPAESPAT